MTLKELRRVILGVERVRVFATWCYIEYEGTVIDIPSRYLEREVSFMYTSMDDHGAYIGIAMDSIKEDEQ